MKITRPTHIQYVKKHKSDFSKYIFGDSRHYLKLTKRTFLMYMMEYSKEFYENTIRENSLNQLLDDE